MTQHVHTTTEDLTECPMVVCNTKLAALIDGQRLTYVSCLIAVHRSIIDCNKVCTCSEERVIILHDLIEDECDDV